MSGRKEASEDAFVLVDNANRVFQVPASLSTRGELARRMYLSPFQVGRKPEQLVRRVGDET
jgi:hypothetical protein